MLLRFISSLFLFCTASTCIIGQVTIPGTYEEDQRRLEWIKADSSRRMVYYPSVEVPLEEELGFKWVDPMVMTSVNTSYVRSFNDGPLWKGKGLTTSFYGGFQWNKGILNVAFAPLIYLSQNGELDLTDPVAGRNPFAYQFTAAGDIDYVQKFGDKSFWKFHPGQSDISLNFKHVSAGASTQNFAFGPARYNHIIMSTSGEGFPHAYLRTNEKIALRAKGADLGKFEAFLFYGLLQESDYFDTNEDNDQRYINGFSVGYEIPYLKGVTLGFSNVLYKDVEFFQTADLYAFLHVKDDGVLVDDQGDTTRNTGNDFFDQMAAIFLEWKIPDYDLRMYFEFGRGDFNGIGRRLLQEFEHSRVYNAGIEKVWEFPSGDNLHLSYEHIFLPRYQSYRYRPNPPFYLHGVNKQGYTHNGQLLGAGVGPGAVSDIVDLNLFKGENIFGFKMQRLRYDEDYLISSIDDNRDKQFRHDIEYSGTLKYVKVSDRWVWGVDGTFSIRLNAFFRTETHEINIMGNAFLRYRI
ncbi:MAG: hypothetical protein KI790_15300 [Cyclobacteriaceae bacterium]|nr:hypothetical protein [Cyclobacteriaceae bacterium HetDA_MAG_MS6]